MLPRLLQLAVAFGIFTVTLQRKLDVRQLREIDDILRSVDNIKDSQELHDDEADRLKSVDQKSELSDIEALNLNLNHLKNQNRLEDDDFERFLRNQNNELCRNGRCGCDSSTGRCGDSVVRDRTVKDVNYLIDSLDRNLNRARDDDDDTNNNRNDDDRENANVFDSNDRNNDRNNARNSRVSDNHIDVVVVNDLRDLDEVLRQSGLIDSINVDERNDFVDITRDNNQQHSVVRGEHMDREHFMQHLSTLKDKVTNDLVDYVTSKHAKKPNLSLMNRSQKRKIRVPKGKMRWNKRRMPIDDVLADINEILFGNDSNIRIVPSENNSDNVVLPNWVYQLVKNTDTNSLRAPKRMFPLTVKQRSRMASKTRSSNRIPLMSTYWRRNFGNNLQSYGLPFKLAIEGLGQFND